MNFTQSIKTCFKKYATFSGRASRSEFWWWVLFTNVTGNILRFIDQNLFESDIGVLLIIFTLATFLPQLAVNVRRLHDTNHSGGWFAAIFPPLAIFYIGIIYDLPATIKGITTLLLVVCSIILLVFFCKKGTVGDNRFGKDPLEENK